MKPISFIIFCALLFVVAAAGVAVQSLESPGPAAQLVHQLLVLP